MQIMHETHLKRSSANLNETRRTRRTTNISNIRNKKDLKKIIATIIKIIIKSTSEQQLKLAQHSNKTIITKNINYKQQQN